MLRAITNHAMINGVRPRCQFFWNSLNAQLEEYDGLHKYNTADVLTKFRGVHADPVMSLMRDSSYVLRKEDTESADRAKQWQEVVFSTRLQRTAPVNHLSDVLKV